MRISKKIIGGIAVMLMNGALSAHADSVEEVSTSRGPNPAKYQQRIKDLGDQIQLLGNKGLITKEEVAQFMERQSQLGKSEESVRNGGFQKPATDELEKSVTLLNADVFKASHKSNPIKPGQAEKEVNDPNLVPAYPDANLQPGSGVVDKK